MNELTCWIGPFNRTAWRMFGVMIGCLMPFALSALTLGPTDITINGNWLYENSSSQQTVGFLSTVETPHSPEYEYTLVSGEGDADNSSFKIVWTSDRLQANTTFNFEAKQRYSVRVRSMNIVTFDWIEKSFEISVVNRNEGPTDIKLSNYKVAENLPAGTMVGVISSADQDWVETNTFSFVSGDGNTDNSLFYISNKFVYTSIPFNYEAKSRFTVRLRCVDKGGLSFEKPIIITATDVNEAPTALTLSNTSVAENRPVGTTVGVLGAVDPDAGQTFTYSLVAGKGSTDNASFTIANGQLRTASFFNFEGRSNYSIRLRVTDNGPGNLYLEKNFIIAVTNVNEDPYGLALSSSTVAENEPAGAQVGSFIVSDRDAGDTCVIALVAGDGSADNAWFTVYKNLLRTAAPFNFEAKKASLSIRARVTDKGGLTYEKAFVISVTNVNEAPNGLALSNRFIEENVPPETLIGAFSATDPDSGNTVTFRLAAGTGDDDNDLFVLTGNSLYSGAEFDYESRNRYSIRVRATDQNGLWFEQKFTIVVLDAVDPTTELRVNCGGNSISNWSADVGFAGGIAITGALPVANETQAPDGVFRTGRKGTPDLAYAFPLVPDGFYKVRFRLAELIFNAEGRRVFNIWLEGVQVATNLDVFALAGGKNKAVSKTFTIDVHDGNGLQIAGESVTAAALFNGIEVWPVARSGSGGSGALAAALAPVALAPDRIHVSGLTDEFAEPWDLADGDLDTAWGVAAEDGRGWVEFAYEGEVSVSDVMVFQEADADEDVRFLGQVDGGEWFDLQEELNGLDDQVEVDAIRVLTPSNADGSVLEIREIQVQGVRVP